MDKVVLSDDVNLPVLQIQSRLPRRAPELSAVGWVERSDSFG
jgi:hypothetical protein